MLLNGIKAKEEIYEYIKYQLMVPIQPLRLLKFMEKWGNLRMTNGDTILLCECLPDSI